MGRVCARVWMEPRRAAGEPAPSGSLLVNSGWLGARARWAHAGPDRMREGMKKGEPDQGAESSARVKESAAGPWGRGACTRGVCLRKADTGGEPSEGGTWLRVQRLGRCKTTTHAQKRVCAGERQVLEGPREHTVCVLSVRSKGGRAAARGGRAVLQSRVLQVGVGWGIAAPPSVEGVSKELGG